MGWIFILAALIFFFLAAVGSTLIPNATSWGFVCGLRLPGRRPPGRQLCAELEVAVERTSQHGDMTS